MYIYDYNLQFFSPIEIIFLDKTLKFLYKLIALFSNFHYSMLKLNITSSLRCSGPSANSVWRACPVFQNVRWRFFVVNDTFHQGITKPSIFALRASCFTETLSIWLCQCSALQEKQNQNKNSDNFRQKRKSPEKIKAICTTKSSF